MLKFVVLVVALAAVQGASVPTQFLTPHIKDSMPEFEGAINKGDNASLSDFPYFAALFHKEGDYTILKCSSSLISDQFLLTTAQCVSGTEASDWHVIPGVVERKLFDNAAKYNLEQFTIHPGFSNDLNKGFPNDIALLKTQTPMQLNTYIQFIKMDFTGSDWNNTDAKTAGFGQTEKDGVITHLEKLQGLKGTIVPLQKCQSVVGEDVPLSSDYQNCWSSYGAITFGDFGSPIVIQGNHGNPIQIGISSFGYYNNQGYPTIFTRLNAYTLWITHNMRN